MIKKKYPRTPHVPWSDSISSDDNRHDESTMESLFGGQDVVVTEKMDGECTTIYSDGTCHARSIDSKNHKSRDYVKALAARLGPHMEPNSRIMGENLFARHSIPYDSLKDYFLVFGVAICDRFLAYDEMNDFVRNLGIKLYGVPLIYQGVFNKDLIHRAWNARNSLHISEGYVIRLRDSFLEDDFSKSVAKYVRKDHVQTDKHWMYKPIVRNNLG